MMSPPAASTARIAVCWRCLCESGAVQAMKIGATPTGSMITVSVTNVVPMASKCTASVAVHREVHVVLRVPGPAAAPAPADRGEGLSHLRGDHSLPVARAVAVGLRLRVAAHATADVGVLDRVEVDGQPVRVVGPAARPGAPAARRWHRLSALERAARVAVGRLLRVHA